MSAEQPLSATTLADFSALAHLSDLSDLALTPSEAHGIYCGLLCSGKRDCLARWLDEILPKTPTSDHDSANCRAALTQVAEQTLAAIQGPEGAFTPLLPEPEAPLAARAEAVSDWSRGFLYGLGLNGCDPNSFSEITRDALGDLTEITHMDVNELDDSEDNEQSLAEVTEFLWVVAMLVYEEQAQAQAR
ncbi:UPF0149 family protein [Thiorhodovibrio frisius]|uniref:YecA family protein n=1 Tax=Thiorhodovibrio frisius TaxID=631362 RepID=H8YZ03_9GAMM|nr:UPF0149 family protein [Thiorhodovibrio frisius]EIC21930.1 hypothetical protein Thi970DRAFT_02166 [Thiorhodovibrio frisius]WPL24219.1 hypothetical protein Thiofri_04435 [Thiorhodovibrio frisius]